MTRYRVVTIIGHAKQYATVDVRGQPIGFTCRPDKAAKLDADAADRLLLRVRRRMAADATVEAVTLDVR